MKEPIQMTQPEHEELWKDGKTGKVTPLSSLTTDELITIKHDLENKQSLLFNKMKNMNKWVKRIDAEADKRNVVIRGLPGEIFEITRA